MPRSTASANLYITNLKREFSERVFSNMEKQQNGLPSCEPPLDFAPFMDMLLYNQYYDTLTEFERDSVIDYEIKILNK